MLITEARAIAENYALEIGEIMPGFRFGIGEGVEFTDKYYFDFIWLTLDDQIPNDPPVAGGALGLTVDKDSKKIKEITHGDYFSLRNKDDELENTYQLILSIKTHRRRLNEVKVKYNLDSKQLLEFYKLIGAIEPNKENIDELVRALLFKVKSRV